MKAAFLVYLAFLGLAGTCNLNIDAPQEKKPDQPVSYSFNCLDSAVGGSETSKAISKTTRIIRNLAVSEKDITDAVQTEWGNSFHKDAIETKTFVLINDPATVAKLQAVMNDLLQARENPSKINYSIYLLDDTTINAFTFGGRIYLTKAMYNKCRNDDDLLYSIIGHEIGHSEKGHIKKTIQEMMIAENIFGEGNGASAYQVMKLLTGAFNQKNELEADYYGIDLAYQLDKNLCSTVNFWTELSKTENQYSRLEDLFRTHPFSSLRAECLRNHIQTNFNRNCNSK